MGDNSVHVVFSAECNHAMTWQAVGLFHSHKAVNQPGPITRLLACSEEQQKDYRGMDIGPTFVHHNMRFGHPLIDETGYPSYNKPASVMFWLAANDIREEFVALLDTDMLLREPLDPRALGARRGVVVSAEYSYLIGTRTNFARRFLSPHEVQLAAQCGGFHIFHREDIRVIAPLWVEYTKRVRAFAAKDMETYLSESFLNWHEQRGVSEFEIATRRKQSLWQAEMYGYAFGAAKANVSTIVRRDTMLYPGYEPPGGMLPAILHYGSDYTIEFEDSTASRDAAGSQPRVREGSVGSAGSIYFNKMTHKELDLHSCPAADGSGPPAAASPPPLPPPLPASSPPLPLPQQQQQKRRSLFFFGTPPPPRDASTGKLRSKRDLLITQHLQLMNAAFCNFYAANCDGFIAQTDCPAEPVGLLGALDVCVDSHEKCAAFHKQGECANNPTWMLAHCAKSCGTCQMQHRDEIKRLLGTVALHGPLAPAAVSSAELTRRLRRHEQRRLGRAAFRRLATHHECTTHCTFFGVRLRYGYRAAPSATLVSSFSPTTATSPNPAIAAMEEEGTCTFELDGECVERVVYVDDDASPLPHKVTGQIGVAEFGAPLDCLAKRVPVVRGDGDGCSFASVSYAGSVAVLPRGGCSFVSKAVHAQASGALGVLMYDPRDERDSIFTMADDGNGSAVLIPVLMLPRSAATQLLKAIDEKPPTAELRRLGLLRGDTGGGHPSGITPLSILHAGQECWWGCHETPGACAAFCGADGACCRRGAGVREWMAPECAVDAGCDGFHCCTAAKSASAARGTGIGSPSSTGADQASNPTLGRGSDESLLVQAVIEMEGMEVTVSAGKVGGADDGSDSSPAGVTPIARTGGSSAAAITASGTTMRCPIGALPTSADGTPTVDKAWLEQHCTKQFPIDPWSIDDEMWDAMRCSTSPALH